MILSKEEIDFIERLKYFYEEVLNREYFSLEKFVDDQKVMDTPFEDSVDFEKIYAQKENKELIIEETKKLISGNSVVSTVSPKYKSVSKDAYTYLIFGIRPE